MNDFPGYRDLKFDHDGSKFEVRAIQVAEGWRLGLFKDGQRIPDDGALISHEAMQDLRHTDPSADLVAEAMNAVRDAVLTENVRDPEPPEFGDTTDDDH